MAEAPSDSEPLSRFPTGAEGLDDLLGGGLFKSGIYIVTGTPGCGKTILANQIVFSHARRGGRAVYVTLLAESHARMLAQMRGLAFFDQAAVGSSINFLNGFGPMEEEGLAGLLQLLRSVVREQGADLLVLDGLETAGSLAKSDLDSKKFIKELQTWAGVVGCTVLLLSSSSSEHRSIQPEHTMVDGIVELRMARVDLRMLRELTVIKLRGSAFAEGSHPYLITSGGLRVYPRNESMPTAVTAKQAAAEQTTTGIPTLDEMLCGGVSRGSITLALGSSGSGKTILGLQFLAAGAREGERGLHFGFFESPADLKDKGDRLGLGFSDACRDGLVELIWNPPAEGILDVMGADLIAAVKRYGAKRLFIDGLVGFKQAAYSERLSAFFSLLSQQLSALRVTTLITEETRELFVREIQVPTPGVSAIFQNILFVRHVETGNELSRLISVMKTRDSDHDRALRRFDITSRGIRIGEPFQTSDTAMTGSAGGNARAATRARRGRKK